MSRRGKVVRITKGKAKLNRMTPELLAELVAVHAQCILDQ
jgi:hypothetical protein